MNDNDRPTKFGSLAVGDIYWGGNTYCRVLEIDHFSSRGAVRITRRVLLPGKPEHECPILPYTRPAMGNTWIKTD